MRGATPEQGVTTLVTHLSWTIKLQTEKKCHILNIIYNYFIWVCHMIYILTIIINNMFYYRKRYKTIYKCLKNAFA